MVLLYMYKFKQAEGVLEYDYVLNGGHVTIVLVYSMQTF